MNKVTKITIIICILLFTTALISPSLFLFTVVLICVSALIYIINDNTKKDVQINFTTRSELTRGNQLQTRVNRVDDIVATKQQKQKVLDESITVQNTTQDATTLTQIISKIIPQATIRQNFIPAPQSTSEPTRKRTRAS